jgi:hypothetical protein
MTRSQKIILFTALALIIILYALMNSLRQNEKLPTVKNRKDFSPKTEVEITNPIAVIPKRDGFIDTQNWPVYRGEDLGFEIRYPTGWGIKRLYSVYAKDEIVFLIFSPVPYDFSAGISILNTPFEKVVESESSKNLISTEKINIGELGSVLQITRANSYDEDVSFVFQHGNYTYVMRSSSDLGRAMLATLTFI